MASLEARITARDRLLDCLREAAKQRYRRQERVPGPYGEESAWVGWEAEQMLDLTNLIRLGTGLPPATIDQIRRIEQSACGHSDYADKYALRCAFLALGEED